MKFLKKLFFGSDQDDSDEIINKMANRMIDNMVKFEHQGSCLADDCVANGLQQGKPVFHSQIERFISEDDSYNSRAINSGFMKRMIEYMDAGEVKGLSVEDGDMVFIHKTHLKQFMAEHSDSNAI